MKYPVANLRRNSDVISRNFRLRGEAMQVIAKTLKDERERVKLEQRANHWMRMADIARAKTAENSFIKTELARVSNTLSGFGPD